MNAATAALRRRPPAPPTHSHFEVVDPQFAAWKLALFSILCITALAFGGMVGIVVSSVAAFTLAYSSSVGAMLAALDAFEIVMLLACLFMIAMALATVIELPRTVLRSHRDFRSSLRVAFARTTRCSSAEGLRLAGMRAELLCAVMLPFAGALFMIGFLAAALSTAWVWSMFMSDIVWTIDYVEGLERLVEELKPNE